MMCLYFFLFQPKLLNKIFHGMSWVLGPSAWSKVFAWSFPWHVLYTFSTLCCFVCWFLLILFCPQKSINVIESHSLDFLIEGLFFCNLVISIVWYYWDHIFSTSCNRIPSKYGMISIDYRHFHCLILCLRAWR